MSLLETLLLGAALSMDAFAVTISDMFAYRGMTLRRSLALPVAFGAFQGLMPLIGYFAGQLVSPFIERYAGILTLAILGFIGGKMLFDAVRADGSGDAEDGEGPIADEARGATGRLAGASGTDASAPHRKLTARVVLLQAVATSIDALAVGVSLAALRVEPFGACALIALTTFVLTCVALAIGRRFGTALGEKATVIGGIVLIAIGIKALF